MTPEQASDVRCAEFAVALLDLKSEHGLSQEEFDLVLHEFTHRHAKNRLRNAEEFAKSLGKEV